MITHPNAKINLGLYITEKRPDGYHNLETVFYPVTCLTDTLIIERDVRIDDIEYRQLGNSINCSAENNLVVRAYRLLQTLSGIKGVRITLEKHIPSGAGLGGGSADAAFTLKTLNNIFELNISDNELATLAKKLGADCPFFIYNKPMLATGIGDILTPIDIDLNDYMIDIIKPEVFVSTAEAYAGVKPKQPTENLKHLITNTPIEKWREVLHNDFEDTVLLRHPEIATVKQDMYTRGAIYSAMSGSGSAVFGIFKKS